MHTTTLRRRAAFFVLTVVALPLLIGAVVLQRQAQRARPAPSLTPTAYADPWEQAARVAERYATIADRMRDQNELLAAGATDQLLDGRALPARLWLEERLSDPAAAARVDFAMIVRRDRTSLGVAVADQGARVDGGDIDPRIDPGGVLDRRIDIADRIDEIADAVTGPPPTDLIIRSRALWPDGEFAGWVLTGVVIDQGFVQRLGLPRVAVVADDQIVAATAPPPASVVDAVSPGAIGGSAQADDGSPAAFVTRRLPDAGEREVVTWEPVVAAASPGTASASTAPVSTAPDRTAQWIVWAALLAWALLATWLAARAADRLAGARIRHAALALRQAASGVPGPRALPGGPRELRELAGAVDSVVGELDRRATATADARSQLRDALARLGETLSSSLNLDRTLAVVTDTAMDTVQADRATLVLVTEDDDLDIRIDRGFDLPADTRFTGDSLPGWVARTGLSVRLPADRIVISSAIDTDALAVHQLCVPVPGATTGGQIGALLLGRDDRRPSFTERDLRTVRTFASQAGVAIENVLVHQEARRLSLTDPLTDLWNFRYFQLQALREVEAATRYRRQLGLLIVDLDHFKRINDRHGHPVGDQVLAEVARRIRTSTRLPDVVARYGGEEFVLLLPGTDLAGAVVTAERIRRRVSRLPIVAGGKDALRISVTCSVGVAAYPEHGIAVEELLRHADVALYTAKSQGRDRVVSADDLPEPVEVAGSERRVAAR